MNSQNSLAPPHRRPYSESQRGNAPDELGQGFGKFMLLVSAIGSYQTVEHRMQGESSNNAEIQRYAREFVATWADNERIVNKLALLNRPDALELLKEFRQMYNETLRISTQGSLLSESEVRALSSKVSSIQDRLLVALHDRPL